MALSLPFPASPQDGDAFLSAPVRQNIQAIAQAIQSFDGSQVAARSIQAAALALNADPITRGAETIANFVASGCVWGVSATLTTSMTAGIIYVNGNRVSVLNVAGKLFTASQDTYVDVDYLGNIYYLPVSNNAAAPALTGNAVRVAIIVTGASAVSSVNQVGFDSLGNMIYRTKRLAMSLAADNIGGATSFADAGIIVQFAVTATAFGRATTIAPSDFDPTAPNANLRIRITTPTAQSFTSSYYIGSMRAGTAYPPTGSNPWTIASAATEASLSLAANFVLDNLIPFSVSTILPGDSFYTAYRPSSNSAIVNFVSQTLEYRPTTPLKL
jgi:hypothetical protein